MIFMFWQLCYSTAILCCCNLQQLLRLIWNYEYDELFYLKLKVYKEGGRRQSYCLYWFYSESGQSLFGTVTIVFLPTNSWDEETASTWKWRNTLAPRVSKPMTVMNEHCHGITIRHRSLLICRIYIEALVCESLPSPWANCCLTDISVPVHRKFGMNQQYVRACLNGLQCSTWKLIHDDRTSEQV